MYVLNNLILLSHKICPFVFMISFYLAKFGLLVLPIVLCRHTSNATFPFSVCTHQEACLQRSQAVHFVSLLNNVNIYA